ncbi:hypothetical protein C8J57DRAFT_1537455 [Mycena rebaudengoi]|nr:hypothetical protein C8J57DRAFT_1537455 [Mycena rebaudengoi]
MTVPLGGTGLKYAESSLYAIFFEALFYGLFTFMFTISTFVLIRKRSLSSFNIPLLTISTLMFIMGSMHLGLDMYRILEGFIHFPGGAFAYLLSTGTNNPAYVLKNLLFTLQTLLGDGFITYRLYKVWGGNKFVCIPFVLCFLGSVASGIATLIVQTLRKPSDSLFSAALRDWPTAFSVMTLLVNAGCSSLIAYRIWVCNRQTQVLNLGTLAPIAVIVIESGMVYSISTIVVLALFRADTGAYKIAQDILMQLIGMVFCAIIASLGLDLSNPKRDTMDNSTKASALIFGARAGETSSHESDISRSNQEDDRCLDAEEGTS